MELGWGSYGLGFLAGVVSILSPCVLPLVPIVVGTAVATHRFGAAALAVGLALSFTAVGLFVATVGFAIGLDADWFRKAAAVLLLAFGVLLLSNALQRRFATATTSLGSFGDALLARMRVEGLGGQLLIGSLLGLVWAPCVGPTLGAAATLASQGRSLHQVALAMAMFGVGAGLPLALLGSASRRFFLTTKGNLLQAGLYGKYVLGGLMLAFGLLILTGWDKAVEAYLVEISPGWLTELTTRF